MGPKFFETRMGQKFFERTVPRLVDELADLNTTLKVIADALTARDRSRRSRGCTFPGCETTKKGGS